MPVGPVNPFAASLVTRIASRALAAKPMAFIMLMAPLFTTNWPLRNSVVLNMSVTPRAGILVTAERNS